MKLLRFNYAVKNRTGEYLAPSGYTLNIERATRFNNGEDAKRACLSGEKVVLIENSTEERGDWMPTEEGKK